MSPLLLPNTSYALQDHAGVIAVTDSCLRKLKRFLSLSNFVFVQICMIFCVWYQMFDIQNGVQVRVCTHESGQ